MPSGIAFIQWNSYSGGSKSRGLFAAEPLGFSSGQERLHLLSVGNRLWLVSRNPEDQQYYFVGVLQIAELRHNPRDGSLAREFGEFAVLADRARSHELGKRFPAEGLLRTFEFDTNRPIRFGASIGQSLQTVRLLAPTEERVLEAALRRVLETDTGFLDAPFGLWTKCDLVFAEYFLRNWESRRNPLGFLLYDSPPALLPGAPVFIHSEKHLRLLGSFQASHFVAGHKQTVDPSEREAERERVWNSFRAGTLEPQTRKDFDSFWDDQNGVRALFTIENLTALPEPLPFKVYGRALEWGYPRGVGYRYLTLSQSVLLVRASRLLDPVGEFYLSKLLQSEIRPR